MDTTPLSLLDQASASVISFLQLQVIYSTIVFAVVAVVAWVFRKKSPYLQLGLWSLILLRLVLPTDLGTSWSARSLVDHIPWSQTGVVVDMIRPLIDTVGGDRDTVNHLQAHETVGQPLTDLEKEPAIGPKHLPWQVFLFMFWLSGVTGFSIIYIGRLFKFYQLIGRAAEIRQPMLQRSLAVWKERFCIKRSVRLVSSAEFLSPFTVGMIRPVIFIPVQLVETEDAEITEMCIAHEMAHVRRLDDFWVKAQQLIQILFFFHPVTWFAGRQIHQARERLCDQMVLQKSVSSLKYGRSMLKVLQNNLFGGPQVVLFPGFGHQKKQIFQRMNEIVQGNSASKTTTIWITCALVILALVLLPMASSSSQHDRGTGQYRSAVPQALTIPEDIQKFLDDFAHAAMKHKMDRIADFHAADYLHYGINKVERMTRWYRFYPRLVFLEFVITKCDWNDKLAILDGYYKVNRRRRTNFPMMLIKENGQWKMYGNQLDRKTFFRPDLSGYLLRNQ